MDIKNILRIFKNVINNAQTAADAVSDAAETPLGEKVITVISIVLVALAVIIVVSLFGALTHTLLKTFNGDLGCTLGVSVGTVIFAVSSGGCGWFGVLTAIVIVSCGAVTAGAMLKLIRDYDLKRAAKRMNQGFIWLYAFFIVGIFVISPQMYGILPLRLNKWCLYITAVLMAFSSMTSIWYSFTDEAENE